MISEEKKKRFEEAKNHTIHIDRKRLGIGTLSEKTVHAVLKNYYAPDSENQEVRIGGYVADIFLWDAGMDPDAGMELDTGMDSDADMELDTGINSDPGRKENDADKKKGGIYEIQTRQFYRMKEKLNAFLPQYPVTICYPIPREKNLIWINPENGELVQGRKSPAKGTKYHILPELYGIREYLKNPNLKLRLILMDMDEYKIADGWGKENHKNSTKFDRIPTVLVDEIEINRPGDYRQFLPEGLPDQFTAKEYAKCAKIKKEMAGKALGVLYEVGVIERVGKKSRAYLYQTIPSENR